MEEEKQCKIKFNEIEETAKYRTFSSGKKGYGFYGKVQVNGKKCQVSLNIIELE